MQFVILTMYPSLIDGYLNETYLKRAIVNKELEIKIINQRLSNKNLANIYDTPFGHGPGIIMRVDNFYQNMAPYLKNNHTILFSPKGIKLTQKKLFELSQIKKPINLICSRFEGYDKRIETYCDEIISIGDYVISGGELCALIIIEGIYRLQGKEIKKESIIEESFGPKGDLPKKEYDQYTRPRNFQNQKVPEVLFSGNHKKIEKWKKNNS